MKYLIRKYFYLILALIPFLYLVFWVVKYKVAVPVDDQWDLVALLEKFYQGSLSLHDLWGQQSEHRLFFPKTIMIILASLSGWNISYELAVNILLGLGIFAAIVYQIKMTAKSVGSQRMNWIIPIVSLMVFSLTQWENWFWGWQIQIFLNVLAVVTGIILLANPVFKWSYFRAALLLGIVATYSFANGISYWFIGLLILFFVSPNNKRIMKASVILWAASGFIIICSYLYDYHKPSGYHYGVIFEQPLEYIKYVFYYLGAPIVNFSENGAFLFGLLGLIIPLYISRLSIRFRYINFQVLIPYISLTLYAIISALMTGIGRAGLGLGTNQAFSSRYITISSLFWISNAVFLFLFAGINNSELSCQKENKLKKYVSFSILAVIIFLITLNSLYRGIIFRRKRYHYLISLKNALLSGNQDNILTRFYEDPEDVDFVKKNMDILKKYHLSIFRDGTR